MRIVKSFFVFFLLTGFSLAAQNGPIIHIVEYMKAAPKLAGEYVNLETELWADIHRQRAADGQIEDWSLYHVRFSGTASEYDFVTVTTVNGWGALDAAFTSGNMEKYWNNLSPEQQKTVNMTEDYRDLVRRDIVVQNDLLINENQDPDTSPNFLMVNFMDIPSGGMPAYMNMEKNMARPMHEGMMKNGGGMAAWGLYPVSMPSGEDRPYDVVTVDFYNQWSDLGQMPEMSYEDLFEKVHPNMSIDHYEDQIQSTRRLRRTECWELVDGI